MADRYAKHLPGAHTAMVPQWAQDVRPWARPMVIGPPRGHDLTGDIRAVEMLVDEGGGRPRVFYGYIRIPKAAAEQMVAEDGGWVEIGFMTPQLVPWSHVEYVALNREEEAD